MLDKPKIILFALMLVTLFGTIGIALPYPVLAPYFLDYPANNLTRFMGIHPKTLLGISLATYPLGMLIGSNYLGALSDFYGRKKILVMTLTVAVLGYALTAFAIWQESFITFVLARFLTGLCEGNISIARAIAADLHPQLNRTKAFSMLYTASYAGWMIGPILGGFLMVYGVAQVFLLAGIGLLLSLGLVVLLIKQDKITTTTHDIKSILRHQHSFSLFKHKEVIPLFLFYFIYCIGLTAFYNFFPVWFVDYFHADGRTISMATISLNIMMIVCSIFVVAWLQEKLGHYYSMLFFGLLLSLMLFIQPFASLSQSYLIFAGIGGAIAIVNGMFPSLLSEKFGHLGQGKVMGLQVSIFCLTNVLTSIFGGQLAIFDSRYVLLFGAFMVLLSIFSLLYNKKNIEQITI
jgi:MFS family permease